MHTLVQTDREPIPESLLSSTLIDHTSLLAFDAKQIAKRNFGILCELEEMEAAKVAQMLTQCGCPAISVPSENVPVLPRLNVLQWVMTSAAGIAFPFGIHQKMSVVEWTSVFCVASTTLHLMARQPGAHDEIDYSRKAVRSDVEDTIARPTPVTDLTCITTAGSFQRLRIVMGQTGNRDNVRPANVREPVGRTTEYKELVQSILDGAQQAIVSPETEAMLADRHLGNVEEKNANWIGIGEVAFDQVNRWLLLLSVLQEQKNSAE